jgi:iron-only hydrogenase group A
MVKLKIDHIDVEVEAGTSILDAAKKVQVDIPTLCYHPDLEPTAACGLCIVKVNGRMVRSCCTPVAEGMEVLTRDPEIINERRTVLKLILSRHPNECLTCLKNENCELRKKASDFGFRQDNFKKIALSHDEAPLDTSTRTIVLDPRKCILCGRCVQVCQNVQDVWALCFLNRGMKNHIAVAGNIPLDESPCIKCGQCVAHCPTGALTEYDDTGRVWRALMDPEKYCVVQIAPAVRVAIGEAFGKRPGELSTKKLYSALRRLGFKAVFDTNFGADVTIMEEGSELVERLTKNQDKLPLITSCCPAWVDYMQKYYPDMIEHFSTCKSPHEIVGVLTKTYYAEKMGIDPEKIVVVSVMPCTAKKYEIRRNETMFSSGWQDVDVSLTTREISRMIKQAGIEFDKLEDEEADSPLGGYSGAGTIFGYSGGVMEAALRTAHYLVTGKEMKDVDILPVRGIDKGIKEMQVDLNGKILKIAVAHGTGNVNKLLSVVREAKEKGEEPPYHFIEVMACPGGCIGGGGQPVGVTNEVRALRTQGLVQDDHQSKQRESHLNPDVQKLYEEFLEKPLSEKAHHYLHTIYNAVPVYKR